MVEGRCAGKSGSHSVCQQTSAWTAPPPSLGAQVVAAARTRIGDPYVWGATGPNAFDCSGLVVWSYRQIGMTLPRTTYAMAADGQSVDRANLQLGDVILYYTDNSHCALYSGNGNVIEASTTGVPVEEVPIDSAGPYNCARRFLPQESQPVTLFGPDVSNNNWSSSQQVIQFVNSLPPQGFSWLEAKCSQGSSYQDPYWQVTLQAAQAAGIPCVPYHYVTTDDPAAQAQCFVSNGGGNVAMFDFEAGSGDIANFWAVANAFDNAGVQVILSYVPQWYWQQIGSPDLSQVPGLISSAYPSTAEGYASALYTQGGGDTGEGWSAYGGATPVIWQFTDAANVGGVSVDCNAFRGSVAELQQLLNPNPTPAPAPTPAPIQPTPGGNPFMALSDQQQADLYNAVMSIAALVFDNNTQLRGPNQQGWPQLGQNAKGQNLTVVDALATVKTLVEAKETPAS